MAVEFPGDLDVGSASKFLFPPLSLQVPEYQDIGRSFWAGLGRMVALGWMPAELMFWSGMYIAAGCEAKRILGLDLMADCNDAAFTEKLDIILGEVSPFKDGNIPEASKQIFESGNTRLKALLQQTKHIGHYPHRAQAFEAMLSAMITGGYASLEAMATDLWIAALNRHPSLAARFVEKGGEKQIPWSVIVGYGFNIQRVAGKILFDTKKVSFQSFHDIKNAYETAFGDAMVPIFQDIKEIVRTEKIRHLIAHRNGVVDAKFKSEMKVYPEYADLPIGGALPLNGLIVAEQLSACATFGTSLFNAVDNWSLAADAEGR